MDRWTSRGVCVVLSAVGGWACSPPTKSLGEDSGGTDCVGAVEERFEDADLDGYGAAGAVARRVCSDLAGFALASGDCDDRDIAVNPGATDVPYDGIDQDCDGSDTRDVDSDGHDGRDAGGDDCDDEDPTVSPSVGEVWYDGVDQNCDGADDYDADGDGVRSDSHGGEDCDDSRAHVHPGMEEVEGNGLDDDCSGDSNGNKVEGVQSVAGASVRWLDVQAGSWLGRNVAFGGDVSGSGHDDVLLSAVRYSGVATSMGAVYLFAAEDIADSESRREVWTNDARAMFVGEDSYATAGYGVAGLGDVDGDGFGDFAVSAHQATHATSEEGEVYIILGPVSGSHSLSVAADAMLWGAAADTRIGTGLAAGDLTGDGLSDLIVASYSDDTFGRNGGAVRVVSAPLSRNLELDGSACVTLSPEGLDGEQLGYSVAVGDIDGDGFEDLAVGAPYASVSEHDEAGLLYLVSGPITSGASVADVAEARLESAAPSDSLGYSLSVGDLTGDGTNDVAVGARRVRDATGATVGAAYVLAGQPAFFDGTLRGVVADHAIAMVHGAVSLEYLGSSVSADGDLDGDGVDDLAIGAPGATVGGLDHNGAAWVLHGPVSGTHLPNAGGWAGRVGERPGDELGLSVASGGDFDADGFDDLLVGGIGVDVDGTERGAAFLILGGGL